MLDTTTLSTIVLQRQSTRIVVAFLKSGSKINLKVLEMQPDLGYLGRDFEEAATLQKSFVEVLQQLQSKQSPVEDLLRQADQLIVNQKPKACVYSAMAESLGVAWQDLHRLIEQRRTIIDKNFLFQGHLQDFECKVADLEGMIAKAQNSWKIPATKELTRQRKIILEASVFALQEGDSLLGILNDAWLKTVPGITPQSLRQSLARAVETVEIWMETIYDRRTSVMSSLKTFLDNQIWPLDLGSSLLEVEELLLKNKNSEQIELLKKARKFFESSKEAFGKLDLLESHYDQKTYEEADKLVEIAKNFGQTLISSSNNVETKGVQNCLTSLTEKSEAIKRICDSKRRNSTSLKNFKGQIDEIDNWLKSFSATVDDVGQTIQEVNRFLSNCKNNLCALQRKSHEIEGMLGALKIMSEDGEVSPDYEKVIRQLLQEGQRQEERIEIANSLMKFLKVTKDIEEEMNGGNDLERKRQNLQQLYLQACNLSKNCIALLDEKVHARIDAEKIKDNIGQIMDGINNRQNELIAAWNRVKSKESQKQKTERLLEDLRVSWESGFNPFISLSSIEPAFVVSSLEKSYGHIAKTRDILKRLIDLNSDDMISRDPITRGQVKAL